MKRAATTLTVAVLWLLASAASAATITLGTYNLQENTPNQKIPIYIVGEVGDPAVAGINFNVQIADGGPEASAIPGWPAGTIDGPIISYVQLVSDETTVDIFGVPPGDLSESQRGNGYDAYHTTDFGPTFFDGSGNFGHIFRGWPPFVLPGPEPWTVPQFYLESTAFTSGGMLIPVGTETLLGVVTIDTTGFFLDDANDSWDLKIGDPTNGSTLNGPTVLLDTSPFQPTAIPLTIIDGQLTLIPEPSTLALVLIGLL